MPQPTSLRVRQVLTGLVLACGSWMVQAGQTPAIVIETIRCADRAYPAKDGMELPERTTSIEIDYTTIPALPDTRFQYRLEGVDQDWQDVGARQQAYYTNLSAGRYRFHVTAATQGSGGTDAVASLEFVIVPAFTQTWWFRVLCGIGIFIVLWLLYLVRLRQMTLRLRYRLEERYYERERIARELHDTLLQGFQGLVLRFQAIAQQVSDPGTRELIEKTLDRADGVLTEGRDRVRALRELAQPIEDLGLAFLTVGKELSEIRDVDFRVNAPLVPSPLNPIVRDELFQLGREALFNAFQHADASRIQVDIEYGADALRLRIRDDGLGFDLAQVEAGGRPGHWGLLHMRERAARMQARLEIRTAPGEGTTIQLSVPAGTAYCGRIAWSWLKRVAGLAVAEDVIP